MHEVIFLVVFFVNSLGTATPIFYLVPCTLTYAYSVLFCSAMLKLVIFFVEFALETYLNLEEPPWMVNPNENHTVICRKFFVDQERLNFRKTLQGSTVWIFLVSSVSHTDLMSSSRRITG